MKLNSLKWLIWTAAGIALLLLAATAGISLILPGYVESRLVPRLCAEFGLTPEQTQVRRIGWWGADVGPIKLSKAGVPALTLAAVQIDYSPLSLLRGQINGIAIGGLSLDVSVTPQGVTVAGVGTSSRKTAAAPGEAAFDLQTLLPVGLERFSVVQSHMVLNWRNRRYDIPFELAAHTGDLDKGRLEGRVDMRLLGNPIVLSLSLEQAEQRGKVTFQADGFRLESLSLLELVPAGIDLKGVADIEGRASFDPQTLNFKGLSISGRLPRVHMAASNLTLGNLTENGNQARPIALQIRGDDPSALQWSFEPFQIVSQIKTEVRTFNGTLGSSKEGWALESAMQTFIPAQKLGPGAGLEKELAVDWLATAELARSDGKIAFNARGRGKGPLAAAAGERKVSGNNLAFDFSGLAHNEEVKTTGRVTVKGIRFKSPQGNLTAPIFRLDSYMTVYPAASKQASTIAAHGSLTGVRAAAGATTVSIPAIDLKARGRRTTDRPWIFDGRLTVAKGSAVDASRGIQVKGFSMDLPLSWPDAKAGGAGRLRTVGITWNRKAVGTLEGEIRQQDRGLDMDLRHVSKLFPGLIVYIKAGLDANGAVARMEIPPYAPPQDIDLGRFNSAAAGILAGGRISARGELEVTGTDTKGKALLELHQGRLHKESQGLSAEGLDMTLRMNDITAMKSAPRQKLSVSRLAFGKLNAQNLRVDFQLEGPETLFIERARIQWCRGEIDTSAIRINAEKEDYDVTLFCDRLNLAMLLEQLGAAKANGEGTVNGRIPVRWTDGRLSFDNGFLYSTPGQTGTIQITGTEGILAGLPPGTPQHTQLDIASEALKDYTYEWAKLHVLSEDDILLLKLQLDGKPNRQLPFAYDQARGQFTRVKGEGQATFQGISIDLNLRSPLNEIINYKGLFQ